MRAVVVTAASLAMVGSSGDARGEAKSHFISGVEKSYNEGTIVIPFWMGGGMSFASGDLPGGRTYSYKPFELAWGAHAYTQRRTSMATPVLIGFGMNVRAGYSDDFEDPANPGGGAGALGFGMNVSFTYALVHGKQVGLSFEPSAEFMLAFGSGYYPLPWRLTRHAALAGTLHGGVRVGQDVVVGLDAKVTPFVNAVTPYDDILELRGAVRLDTRHVIVRAEYARTRVKGNDAMLGALDGDATEFGGSVMFKIMGK
jgi:hypothetical protein